MPKAMPPRAGNDITPIFLLGRFRSGTTALWQFFDRLPGHTAWYEPLHPNLPAAITHTRPKVSHQHVEDYWLAYRGLAEPVNEYWRRDFATSHLHLEADAQWPELKTYIDWLIGQSSGRPVLQFNRMDLRLGWLRKQYPEAKIITIRRSPYPLWLSARRHIPEQQRTDESYPDAYELMQWSCALAVDFPFLAPQPGRHGYFRHYTLWRLSTIMADAHADYRLQLENLADDARGLSHWLGWSAEEEIVALAGLAPPPAIEPTPPEALQSIEQEVDNLLRHSGLADAFGRLPLAEIRRQHADWWHNQLPDTAAVSRELLHALYAREDEITRLLAEVQCHIPANKT